jgi:hypothetical protein
MASAKLEGLAIPSLTLADDLSLPKGMHAEPQRLSTSLPLWIAQKQTLFAIIT